MRRHRTAGDHQGVIVTAVGAAERDAAQVEHGQDVRVRELELKREPDYVEVREGSPALERHQRQPPGGELGLKVDPRRVATLGQRARVVVEDLVEDAIAQVAHADVVDIGKGQADAGLHGAPVLAAAAVLTAGVAGGLLDLLQEGGVGMIEQGGHGNMGDT